MIAPKDGEWEERKKLRNQSHLLVGLELFYFNLVLSFCFRHGERINVMRVFNCLLFYIIHRYNARGFDLNRNFPDYFKQNTKRNQPETEAVKAWLSKIQFVLSGSLHGGALVASYPYDNTPNSSTYPSVVVVVVVGWTV